MPSEKRKFQDAGDQTQFSSDRMQRRHPSSREEGRRSIQEDITRRIATKYLESAQTQTQDENSSQLSRPPEELQMDIERYQSTISYIEASIKHGVIDESDGKKALNTLNAELNVELMRPGLIRSVQENIIRRIATKYLESAQTQTQDENSSQLSRPPENLQIDIERYQSVISYIEANITLGAINKSDGKKALNTLNAELELKKATFEPPFKYLRGWTVASQKFGAKTTDHPDEPRLEGPSLFDDPDSPATLLHTGVPTLREMIANTIGNSIPHDAILEPYWQDDFLVVGHTQRTMW